MVYSEINEYYTQLCSFRHKLTAQAAFFLFWIAESESRRGLHPNYAFLVTKKLRQRGISLIVGSSSSGMFSNRNFLNIDGLLTTIRFSEPARLSTPSKPLFQRKPLVSNPIVVIAVLGLPLHLTSRGHVGVVNTSFPPSNWHWTFRNNYTTQYPMLIYWQAYRSKKNENRQNYSFSSTRNSVSKLCRADLQYLGLKTPLKTVNFQLFFWVLLFQYSKKFDFPEGCLVSLVDIGNCKVKPSIQVQLFPSPIVNLLSLFKIFVSLK